MHFTGVTCAEEFARPKAAELAREIAAAKTAAAVSGKPPVVVGDLTAMSFEEFDTIIMAAADDA